ncbi:aromatic acid exporter family protein [Bacillus xiapuensis]|uniref:aromatic acid exporter family protein n=1 Tax=Bacillus xiapuensis TaxID=2014075 RepID=UPI000C237A12|nr:aromatic acid exporter family protein [Bacillus xiapuensis]
MFKIGYRTIKTAIGTALAIIISQSMSLENFVSAGIITILCIQNTKKKSLQAAWSRFRACTIAIIFCAIFFEGIGFHPLMIGLLLLFFIPTVVALKVKEGIVTSSVIILHMYSAGEITKSVILNEYGIIIVGMGIALLMNLYMPSLEKRLYRLQDEIEENFRRIFQEIAMYLRDNQHVWDGKEITETVKLIKEGKEFAFQDIENHFLREEKLFYSYFSMRQKQFERIERVLSIITSISHQVEQAHVIADFMEELGERIHPGNTAHLSLQKLERMRAEFEKMDLPATREEFESRAALLQFIKEMEEYLLIKSSFKGMKRESRPSYIREAREAGS